MQHMSDHWQQIKAKEELRKRVILTNISNQKLLRNPSRHPLLPWQSEGSAMHLVLNPRMASNFPSNCPQEHDSFVNSPLQNHARIFTILSLNPMTSTFPFALLHHPPSSPDSSEAISMSSRVVNA